MIKYFVSYIYQRPGSVISFGDTTVLVKGPLTEQAIRDMRQSIGEAVGASNLVIMNLIRLEA